VTIAFSASAEKRFREILGAYPSREAALLPVLHLSQEEFGHLSAEVRSYVANRLELALARVEGVVSFYTLYATEPTSRHRVQICRNISCRLRGSDELISWMEKEAGIDAEAGTPRSVEYSAVECLAACGGAPAVRVNNDYRENTDLADLKRVIGKLKGEPDGKDR
jgi:NADH-quinone oxidoreductase subunit E